MCSSCSWLLLELPLLLLVAPPGPASLTHRRHAQMLRSVCLVAAAAAAVVSADGEFGPARRQWQGVAAAVRDELSSMVNGQYGPQHAPSYEIVTPNVDAASSATSSGS